MSNYIKKRVDFLKTNLIVKHIENLQFISAIYNNNWYVQSLFYAKPSGEKKSCHISIHKYDGLACVPSF